MKPNVLTALVLAAFVRTFVDGASHNSHNFDDDNGADDSSQGPSCFVCTWVDDLDPCGDANFTLEAEQHGHYMVNCKVCYKKIMYNSTGSKLGILRGCVLDEWAYLPKCQYTYFENGLYTEVCGCTTDYCNAATQRSADVTTILTLAVAVGLYVVARNHEAGFSP